MTFKHPWNLEALRPSPTLEAMDRDQLVTFAQAIFREWYGDIYNEGNCLMWAHVACVVLTISGRRALLQAGSMSWPMAPDRGTNHTHFSYVWQPGHPASVARIAQGALPELHCWAGLPDTGEIVDLSTYNFRNLAERQHGLKWEGGDPPPYLWAKGEELPKGVLYRAELPAIVHVINFVNAKQQRAEVAA